MTEDEYGSSGTGEVRDFQRDLEGMTTEIGIAKKWAEQAFRRGEVLREKEEKQSRGV